MGKKRIDAAARYDRAATYQPDEAVRLVKDLATAKFDETVEAAFQLGIDARQADQGVRGTVSLPNGTGKTVRVAVFADGEGLREAEEAGISLDDMISRLLVHGILHLVGFDHEGDEGAARKMEQRSTELLAILD